MRTTMENLLVALGDIELSEKASRVCGLYGELST
jgi:hypothetical protein